MLIKIDIVTLIVSDQRQSLTFFRDLLGFEVRDDEDFMPGIRWITVAPPGGQARFSLWPAGALGAEDKQPGGMTGISFTCDDAHATHEELRVKHIVTQPVEEQPWGLSFMFMDHDKNWFNVVQPR
jgi:catechol 2,3-dioxygenase-like lactoylglutathione lyase family enzyme